MSIVSVWTNSKPRVEVRTTSQAVGETGRRMSDILLLPRQADLLAHPSLSRLYLTGPMGSGKTLLLQLKGRQWVREGRRVVVINVRTIARGRPIGHVLEQALKREVKPHCSGSVYRHDVASEEFTVDALHKELTTTGPTDNVCFVVDELQSDVSNIPRQLTQHYPHSPIWCVASYVTPVPKTFRRVRLQAVLRSPPSVQLLLKELDLNPDHGHVYTTRSATRGLPCDGPPVIFIQHSKHHAPVRHLDCDQCAEELADIFEKKLGLKLRPPTLESEEQQLAGTASQLQPDPVAKPPACHTRSRAAEKQPRRDPKAAEAAPLTFRDVLILVAMPFSTYKRVVNYTWEASVPELLKYMMYMGTCRFLSGLKRRGVPLRVVVDNTTKEIAYPSADEVILTDFLGAHSMERKVVVFLRGGSTLTTAELTENLLRYKTFQTNPLLLQLALSLAAGAASASSDSAQEGEETLTKDKLLFAMLMYEIRDIMYPQLPTFSNSMENAKAIMEVLFGNAVMAESQYYIEGKTKPKSMLSRETPLHALDPQVNPQSLRIGMEIREKLPMLRSPPTTPEQQRVNESAPGENEFHEEQGEQVEADSMFLVPDVHEDLGWREGEVSRLQQAMAQLSEDDKDWEFFAASRCLSQYISILP